MNQQQRNSEIEKISKTIGQILLSISDEDIIIFIKSMYSLIETDLARGGICSDEQRCGKMDLVNYLQQSFDREYNLEKEENSRMI